MKIFVVNPAFGDGFVKTARWFAKSRGRVQRHPDYLARATAVLEQAGHECVLLDAQAKDMPVAEAEARIRSFAPDLVAIYATTPSLMSDLEFARMAKEATGGALVVMIGSHVSAEPDDTLRRGAGFLDAVTRREYDFTLRELADTGVCEGVAGLSWLRGEEIVHEVDRAPIEDMDSLPFPAWHHIDIEDYHDAGKLFPFITLIGGRGCPAKCTFCQLPQVMYGHRYRTRSPQRILDEMEYDLELFPNLKEIMFEDDTLTLSTHLDRLQEICQGIIDRGINKRISWSCNARPDLTDKETLRLMKASGARMFCTGFEFGNDEMLKRIKKGIGTEKMREYAKNAAEAGIRVHGCFMIGGPGETRESAMQTIRLAQEMEIDTCQFTGVAAYPGTAYYDWAKRNGYIVADDWSQWVDEDREQRGVVDVPGLSMREIEELVDLGLRSFYLRPKQMKTIAKNVKNWSDVRTKLHGLKSFIDYFGKPGEEKRENVS
ncbi:MAG: hopanoid biosynthesis associated radical SAM protein HpnJ [Gemmatimonadota bacterium]|nr:MAG: hopanoid biosynthesis associated radical SAM protein HpnJ [Gemmatimonadota bacterium]